jgi:arylsulfatase A
MNKLHPRFTMSNWRISNWLLGLLLIIGSFVGMPGSEAAETRPNFVVILCDDLGWGDLGCYGHPHIKTPNLDRLAQQGIRLTNCYSPAPVCSPSRVGLLTGRSPARAGVVDWIPEVKEGNKNTQSDSRSLVHMRQEEVTLPRLLKEAGYATALSGKWHCNSMFNSTAQPQPNDAGFDHWFATQNNAGPSHENPKNFVRNGVSVGPQKGFSCQIVANEAIQWMKQTKSEKPRNPFFLYVAFHEPHEPVVSPPELVAKYRSVAINEDQAQYFANVENMDNAVGRILEALAQQGTAENTFVYFSSDNGPETLDRYPNANRSHGSAGHLRGHKLWTTEAGFRVAGIMRYPKGMTDKIKSGNVIDQPISSLDLLPSFVSLAGAKVPAGLHLDGVDFGPLFSGETIRRNKPLFWFYWAAINDQRVAMRDGDWKVLAKLDGGSAPTRSNLNASNVDSIRNAKLTDFSLFDLTKDPGEQNDLATQEPQRLAQMKESLERLYKEVTQTMHVWP